MAGGGTTVKLFALVVVPPGVFTLIGPVVAPTGTASPTRRSSDLVKLAVLPLKVTAVAPVKPVPLIVTLVPTRPLMGVKLVMAGGVTTRKTFALYAVP